MRTGWAAHGCFNAKVKRRRFSLVPDYASTGSRVHCVPVLADMVGCADTLAIPAMSGVLTTWVSVPRTSRAQTLLFVRAFRLHNEG